MTQGLRTNGWRRWLLMLVAVLAAGGLGYQLARQSRGDDAPNVLLHTAAGPYRVKIGTIPDALTASGGHLAVDLRSAATGAPVTDASVRVTGAGPDHARLSPTAARNGPVNRQYYDAYLAPGAAGPWRLTVEINGPSGAATVHLPVDVIPTPLPWDLILGWGIPGLLLLAAWAATARERGRIARGRRGAV